MDNITEPTWRSRGYLPHFDVRNVPVAITYRLADSLPVEVLARWDEELRHVPAHLRDDQRRKRIETYLDAGHGGLLLARPDLAAMVERTFLFHDGQRYRLHAWVVMPNHVHVLITPTGSDLAKIVHGWKSFSAHEVLRLTEHRGRFWQPDYFDRAMRNDEHYRRTCEYVEMNPVKAGLCKQPEDWRFSSARLRKLHPGETPGAPERARPPALPVVASYNGGP